MKQIMIVGDYTLNIIHEGTSKHGITYRVAVLPGAENMAFLFDDNNASKKWYLLRLGEPTELVKKVKRISAM